MALTFDSVLRQLQASFSQLRDYRRGQNRQYAVSLFGVEQLPSDPQVRNLLDPITPAGHPTGPSISNCMRGLLARACGLAIRG